MYDDASSIGQASAAVAMATDAIDNARRAAANSRNRRAANPSKSSSASGEWAEPSPPVAPANNGEGGGAAGGAAAPPPSSYSDLKHNDNAYHVIATLVVERLLPKVDGAPPGSTRYSLTDDDDAFLRRMLPPKVRRGFVEALRYRLQLLRSGVGSRRGALGKLTMQCQMLGLDRDAGSNALLDLENGSGGGKSYPINYKSQGPVASVPSGNWEDDNGVKFGLHSPMAENATFSPTSAGNNTKAEDDEDWETSAESLARQQIMTEIEETKVLMRGSVTPDAVKFWRKHLDELGRRLVALNESNDEARLRRRGGRSADASGSYGAPSGIGGGVMSGGDDGTRGRYEAPRVKNTQYAPHFDHPPGGGEANAYPHHSDSTVDAGNSIVRPPSAVAPREDEPVCDVVAPSDLPGGYMFEAQLGSTKFLATVPPGGVTKGQRFVSTMKELETIEIPVPLGAWRDGLMNCCADGMCHPLVLNTLFLPCVAIGQIMTRTGLDWGGEPSNKLVSSLSCANMSVVLMFWFALNGSAALMLRIGWEQGRDIGLEYYAALGLFNALFLLYLVNLTRKVRESIRHKYQIPEELCGGMETGVEDCLCAACCMPCSICQMGRHTADFDTYRATCFTSTGLPQQVELAPVEFYEDQYQNMNNDSQAHIL